MKLQHCCVQNRHVRVLVLAIASLLLAACGATRGQQVAGKTFTNPLLPSGPDPWVTQYAGYYYFTDTLGNRIALWKTRYMSRLAQAAPVVVWRAPASGPNSTSVWSPELHRINGKWYLYYTAANKAHDNDAHRHIFVLENTSSDPTQGAWVNKGMLNTQHTGIDGTVFRWRKQLYFVYSAYVGDHSDLVIAPMLNPWTLSQHQVDIAHPTKRWEMQGGREIMEAPEFLAGPGDKVFLVYSASACWSDGYALGMLSARKNADLISPASWTKSPHPVFASSSAHSAYAPGQVAFFKSPDGSQNWMIYHANSGPDWGCGSRRSPRIQQFHWNTNGTPDFGAPVRTGVPLTVPSR